MFKDQRVIMVMPAYNAAKTLRRTYDEVMEQDYVDQVILVDDGSGDETVYIARSLPKTKVHIHPMNQGYGANQIFKNLYLPSKSFSFLEQWL